MPAVRNHVSATHSGLLLFFNLTCFCLLSSLPSSPHFISATSKAVTSRLRANLTYLVMDLLTVPSLIGTFYLLLATIMVLLHIISDLLHAR